MEAMFTRIERTQKIEVLEKMFGSAIGIYLTDINRISVSRMTALRRAFRKNGLQYVVVKNKLAKIALERCGKPDIVPYLKGQMGVVFAQKEATAPARIIRDFQRDNKDLLGVLAVYVEGTLYDGAACNRLADVPSREVLLAQMLSCLQAPVQNVACALNNVMVKLAATVDAVRAQKEAGEK
jgi:large subunit ribosomal protein L10